jgi:hypothetical protein
MLGQSSEGMPALEGSMNNEEDNQQPALKTTKLKMIP